jgi:hypothetical protein
MFVALWDIEWVIHSDIGPLALDWISIVRGRLEHADKLVESDGEE